MAMKIDTNTYKDNPLKFINTFLRRDGERVITEEEYSKVSKGSPKMYDLRWQVRVRKVFWN